MSIVTEIVRLKTKELVGKDDFIQIVDSLEYNFHSKQKGFIDTELLYDEKDDVWIMIQHWESFEYMKLSSKNMFKEISTETFRNSIDAKTISISVFHILGKWSSKDYKC